MKYDGTVRSPAFVWRALSCRPLFFLTHPNYGEDLFPLSQADFTAGTDMIDAYFYIEGLYLLSVYVSSTL